jgi:hypothetical protein
LPEGVVRPTVCTPNFWQRGSPDCLEQLVVHERTITRWMSQQYGEQRCELSRQANQEEQGHTREALLFNVGKVSIATIQVIRVFASLN